MRIFFAFFLFTLSTLTSQNAWTSSLTNSLPLDDLVMPSIDCIAKPIEVDFPTNQSEIQSYLFSGCFSYHGGISNHWSLIRYYRASIKSRNPSPLAQEVFANIEKNFVGDSVVKEINILNSVSPVRPNYSYGWILRLSLDWDQIWPQSLEVSKMMSRLSQLAADELFKNVSATKGPVFEGSEENTAFNLWQILNWAKKNGDQKKVVKIKEIAKGFYNNSRLCDPLLESAPDIILSSCFSQALLMSEVLVGEDFKVWLRNKIPTPESILEIDCCRFSPQNPKGFSVAPSRLLALSRIKTLVPDSTIWTTAYEKQLRQTLSNVILWKNSPIAVQWAAPLTLLALTSELN